MNEAPFISLQIYTAATSTNAAVTSTNAVAPPPPPTISKPMNTSDTTPVVNAGPKHNICFRLLCHASRIGGFIGKSGSIVKQLQCDTSSKIRVDNAPPGSEDSVISIVADSTVNRTMPFDEECSDEENNGYVDSSEYREVSAAQEALVRVYEKVLNVSAESEGCYFALNGVVSCRLLVDTSLAGFVIGRGGKAVEKIRQDTGCKIRVFDREKLPSCMMTNNVMIEIEGGIFWVKRAIVAISRRVQDCRPPFDKVRMGFGKSYNWEAMLPNRHMNFPAAKPHNGFNEPNGPFGSLVSEIARNFHDQHEIVFRILCSSDRIGGVIGNSGAIVRALENELGALISVSYPAFDCNEQIITITAFERPESQNSPAQNAVIRVFSRSVEVSYEKGLDSPLSGTPISARLVIPRHHMGCLLGKGGSIMADMRKVTGAYIKIVGGNQVPRCASEADQVVLMTGEFVNVRDALYSVTSRLRHHLFSGNGPKTYLQGNGQPPFGLHSTMLPHHFNQHTTLTQSMDNLRLSDNGDHHPSSSVPWQSQMTGHDVDKGSISVKGGIELGRGGRSAIITNTIVEIMVPENVIGFVYGENGSNLTRLRQISGAKVMVHEPSSGTTNHIVVISGTPDQTQLAQSLLQAFILADQQGQNKSTTFLGS